MDSSAVSITQTEEFPFKNNTLEKLRPEECEDISRKERPSRPRNRPRDAAPIWVKNVELAIRMDELRRASRTYEDAVATVAQELHASEGTVKRAYAEYIREPSDPNGAQRRCKWQNEPK